MGTVDAEPPSPWLTSCFPEMLPHIPCKLQPGLRRDPRPWSLQKAGLRPFTVNNPLKAQQEREFWLQLMKFQPGIWNAEMGICS